MSTQTLTDTADFGAIAHCSIESGSVKIGKYNCASDDTGTGTDDFTLDSGDSDGSVSLGTGELSFETVSNTANEWYSVNGLQNTPLAVLAGLNLGDAFDVQMSVSAYAESGVYSPYFMLGLRVDDNDCLFQQARRAADGYKANWQKYIAGSRTYAPTNPAIGGTRATIQLRMTKEQSGSDDLYNVYARLDPADAWGANTSTTDNNFDSGKIFIAAGINTAQLTVGLDDLTFNSGFPGTAQAYVGDQGSGDGRYLDAGSGNTFDYSSLSATLTNATVTWDVKASDTASFDGSSWDYTGKTTAEIQALADSGKRYLQLRANLTATGASPSLDAVSIDELAMVPDAPTVSTSVDNPTLDTTPTWTWTSAGGTYAGGNFRVQLDSEAGSWTDVSTATSWTPASPLSHGSHTLYVQEESTVTGVWSDSGSYAISVDTEAPAAPSVSGPSTPTTDTTPTWTWSASGGGNGTFRRQLDGTGGSWTETTDTSYTPAAPLSEGGHILYVQERDAAGNWSESGSYSLTIDTTPPGAPTVTGTSTPTTDTTPTWNWSAGDPAGNGTYRYQMDSEAGSWTETSSTSYTPGSPLSEGSHTLYVQERDAAGNWSSSGSYEIVIDSTPPGAPDVTGDASTTDTTPTWTWTQGDPAGNGTYRYKLDDANLSSGATETTDLSYTPGAALDLGDHTLYVQERDAAGNWSSSGSHTINVYADAINPPSVTGTTPTTDATPTWSWTSQDVDGDGVYRVQLDSEAGSWTEVSTDTDWTPSEDLAHGAHTLYVQERYNDTLWSDSGSFEIDVDLVAPATPTVAVTSPTNDTTPDFTITAGGGGNGTFRYQVDSEAGAWTETTSLTNTLPAQSDGTHRIYVQERDVAGNWSSSGWADVTVDTAAPTAPSVSVAETPTSDTTPTFSWVAGGGGNGTFRYKLDDSDLSSGATETTDLEYTASTLAYGTHTLYVQERDAAGNWSGSGSATVEIVAVSGDDLRASYRTALLASAELSALLAGGNAVVSPAPAMPPAVPCLAFALAMESDDRLDAGGVFEVEVELTAWAGSAATLTAIADAADAVMDGLVFDDAAWLCRRTVARSRALGVPEHRDSNGTILRTWRGIYRSRVIRKSS